MSFSYLKWDALVAPISSRIRCFMIWRCFWSLTSYAFLPMGSSILAIPNYYFEVLCSRASETMSGRIPWEAYENVASDFVGVGRGLRFYMFSRPPDGRGAAGLWTSKALMGCVVHLLAFECDVHSWDVSLLLNLSWQLLPIWPLLSCGFFSESLPSLVSNFVARGTCQMYVKWINENLRHWGRNIVRCKHVWRGT